MEIKTIENKKNKLVFEIKDVSHGFCNVLKKELWKAGGWNDYWSTRDVLNKKLDKYRSTSQLPSSVTQSDLKSLNKELLALSNIINKVTKKIKWKGEYNGTS